MPAQFVFLHGGGQGGWVWDETMAAISAQTGGAARCLALDGPGCGTKRGRDTAAMDFAAITAELVDDIAVAGMTDVVLVGHSQAGVHMPAMVAARPDLFRKLVFVSCVAPDPGLTVIEMTGERIHGGSHPFNDTTMSERDRYRAMFCNDMSRAQAEAFLDKLGHDGWPRACYAESGWRYDHLADLPVSYVLCLQDAILPLAWQERFAARMHARSTPRIDAGHQAMNTRPHALAEILLAEVAG
ncbi:MAG: alpha/beta hydrolase [Sphingomonadales bacterium]|nr:alpha/beta hydrolase [Sphingomonadales bacterium]